MDELKRNGTVAKSSDYEQRPRHNFSKEQLDNGWRAFKKIRQRQREWRADVYSIIFKEAFGMLPNVVEASCIMATPFHGRTSGWPLWKRLKDQILVTPDDWMYASDYSTDTARAFLTGHAALCLVEAIAFRATFAGTKHVEKLTVHNAHSGTYEGLMGELIRNHTGLDHHRHLLEYQSRRHMLTEGFGNLKHVQLRIPHAARSESDDQRATGEELSMLLIASKNMTSLDLAYSASKSC